MISATDRCAGAARCCTLSLLGSLIFLSGSLAAQNSSQDPTPQDPPAQDPPAQQAPPQDPPQQQEETSQLLPEVVVLGSYQAQGVPLVPLEYPGSRDAIGPKQIKRLGARDLNDLVQSFPAMSTRPYNGGEAAAPSFSMRGLPDDGLTEYVHVLIDGTPAAPLPYGWTAFSFLPLSPERVYAVDLIRGGHTVRYSPNTVGGVLNFITEPVPAQGRQLEFRQWAGSNDFQASSLSLGQALPDGGYRAAYTSRSGDGIRRNAPFDQKDLSLRLEHQVDETTRVTSSFSWFENDHYAPGGLTRASFDADRFGNDRPLNQFNGSRGFFDTVVRRDWSSDSWGEIATALSFTSRRLRAQRPHFGAAAELRDWTDESYFASVSARAESSADWGGLRHRVHGGVRVHREWLPSYRVTSTPWGGGATPTVLQDFAFRTTTLSAHVDDTVQLHPDVQVTAGLRAEFIPQTSGFDPVSDTHYDDSFSALLPALSASWTVTDHAAVFANYNEGFRAPQVWGYSWANGSADALKFERGRSYEVGARYRDGDGWSASAAAWRADFDDFGVFYTGFYENLGAIRAQGVDLALAFDASRWSRALRGWGIDLALTVQDSELQAGPNAGNETPYAWSEKAAWRMFWQPAEQLEWSLGGVYVGPSFSDEANTVAENADGNLGRNSGWTLWDTRLAKDFWLTERATLTVAVGATNLLDSEWEVHSRGGFFGGGLVAGAPRQAYAMVEFQLDW